MGFTCIVKISKPKQEIVQLFSNRFYLEEYPKENQRKELVSGVEGEKGAIYNVYYNQGKKEKVITETIIENKLPNYAIVHYHQPHMDFIIKSIFTSITENKTLYKAEIKDIENRGFLPKTFALLAPWMFRNGIKKGLYIFKINCEEQ